MSWSAIASMIDFYGGSTGTTWPILNANGHVWSVTDVSPVDQAYILALLKEVYDGSDAARNFLDLVVATGTRIPIGTAADGSVAFGLAGYYLAIDLTKVPATYYMDNHGNVVSDKPALTLLHEMQHWFWAATDPGYEASGTSEQRAGYIQAMENTADYDHNGQPVNFCNTVAQEMGWADNIQSGYATGMESYYPVDPRLASFDLTHSYANGAIVDVTRFGDQEWIANRNDNIDQTSRGDSSDLIFGFGGNDVINAGGGVDYVYGGAGDDLIHGGSGNDFLFGNEGNDTVYGDAGNDVLVGSSGGNFLDGGAGNDTIWDRGNGTTIHGGDGDDVIIMSGDNTTADGGAGADTFRVETFEHTAPTENIVIVNPDASDKLFWNGYQLRGGTPQVIEYEVRPGYVYLDDGDVDSNGNIYYRYSDDPSTVYIWLAHQDGGYPAGSWIEIDGFSDGALGLSVPVIVEKHDANGNVIGPGDYPYSAIANDGQIWDFQNLPGAIQTATHYGPEALPSHWYFV